MADIGSITAAIGGLKTAAEITKGFLDLKEAAAVQGRVIELQGVILAAQSSALSAQSDQLALLEEIRELKAKLTELEAWSTESQRYALKDFGSETFAYELKADAANGEPTHRLCPNCYQQGHKSILQNSGGNYSGRSRLLCARCKGEFFIGPYRPQRYD
jgi:hypothetical protein